MCGICGFIRFGDRKPSAVLEQMNDAIRHRGPDDEGYMVSDGDGNIISHSGKDTVAPLIRQFPNINEGGEVALGFGFRRLSILDLSAAGHQPMLSDDKQVVITFNGEIYNYQTLRRELQAAGYAFATGSDTEVLLKGYLHWGLELPKKLNGMFAFALYDKRKQSLWLVRDRLGIKPLFYHQNAQGITWASEIKSVLKAPWVSREINFNGLAGNYLFQTSTPPETCFRDIFSVMPGSWLLIEQDSGKVRKETYWQIPVARPKISITGQDAAAMLDEKLQHIVSQQLQADVPVTSLMSGGIDSTTLTAICSRQHPDFHCYTLGFDNTGTGADELPQAMAMAKTLGIRQHIHIIHPDEVVKDLDASLRHFEEPYVSLEPGLVASKYLHNEGYKVVINGLGGDEVFGGYHYYLNYRQWVRRKKLFGARHMIPSLSPFLEKVKRYMDVDTVLRYFVHARLGMQRPEVERLLGGKVNTALLLKSAEAEYPSIESIPEELYYYDLRYYIGAHHVYRDDLTGMRHSLEMRYPFLDHELIDWVATLPMDIRYDGATGKPLLREVASRYITTTNLSMPKKGFDLPLKQWIQKDSAIMDYAVEKLQRLQKRNLFDLSKLDEWWKHRNDGVYFSKIWQLVTTEVWLDEYVEK